MAYLPESNSRGRARALVSRTGYSPVGGHFKLGGNSDAAADAKMITKGVHEHEGALHKGSPKTRLTFAEGGMAGMPRLDQKSRGGHKSKSNKGHGNTINIAVVPGGGQPAAGAAAPRPPMPVVPPRPPLVGPPGGGMPPGGPPGMPPAAAGGMGAMPPAAMPRPPMAPPPGLPPGVMPPRPPIRTGGRLARGGRAVGGDIEGESGDARTGKTTSWARAGETQREMGRGDAVQNARSSKADGRDFNPSAEKRGGRAKRADGGKSDDGWPGDDEQRTGRAMRPKPAKPLKPARDQWDANYDHEELGLPEKRGGRAKRASGGASDPLDTLDFNREGGGGRARRGMGGDITKYYGKGGEGDGDKRGPDPSAPEKRGGRAKRAEGGASDPLDTLEFPRERRANGGRMAHKQRLSGTANADAQAMIKDPPRLDIGNTSYMSSTSPQLENALAASDKKMIPHQQDQIFQPPPIQRKSGGEVGSGRANMTAGAGSGEGRIQKARQAPGVDHGGIGRA